MDWKQTTYDTLCELFPQIDVRIIKATTLDHGNDIESAVDFLVNEVLVCDVESQRCQITNSSPIVSVNLIQDSTGECSGPEKYSTSLVCDVVQPPEMNDHKEEYECSGSLNLASTLVCEMGKRDEINNHEQEESIVWLSDVGNVNCSLVGEGDTVYRRNENNIEQDFFSVSWNGDAESLNLLENETEVRSITLDNSFNTDQLTFCADTSFGCEELEGTLLSVFSSADVSVELDNQISSASEHCWGCEFSGLQQPFAVSMGGHGTYPIYDRSGFEQTSGCLHSNMPSPVYHGANLPLNSEVELDAGCSLIGKKTQEDFQEDGAFESNIQLCEHHDDDTDEYSTSLGMMDYLSYNANIETLDELVQASSSDKMHLINVMEEICRLQLQADKEQADAQVVKADAAKGGLDTLTKVEEMRNTLTQAREANQMYAGEIFGEKAVLATESREFLSRLVQLKLYQAEIASSLNEVRTAMQTQFDLAAQEREAAEKERDRKEASAREVLATEEQLVAKVSQESRELGAEAEICTRLREFLIDCGSIVGSLQGEMAVLFKDVEALKK